MKNPNHIYSSDISEKLETITANIISLHSVMHEIDVEMTETDLNSPENLLSYLTKDLRTQKLINTIDEEITELGLFFENSKQLEERFNLIRNLYVSQFRKQEESEHDISDEELQQYYDLMGVNPDTIAEEVEEDLDGVDVDTPFPTVNTFSNLVEEAQPKKNPEREQG